MKASVEVDTEWLCPWARSPFRNWRHLDSTCTWVQALAWSAFPSLFLQGDEGQCSSICTVGSNHEHIPPPQMDLDYVMKMSANICLSLFLTGSEKAQSPNYKWMLNYRLNDLFWVFERQTQTLRVSSCLSREFSALKGKSEK